MGKVELEGCSEKRAGFNKDGTKILGELFGIKSWDIKHFSCEIFALFEVTAHRKDLEIVWF